MPPHVNSGRVYLSSEWFGFSGLPAFPLRDGGQFERSKYGLRDLVWVVDEAGALWTAVRSLGQPLLSPTAPPEVREQASNSYTAGAADRIEAALRARPWWVERAEAAGWQAPPIEVPRCPEVLVQRSEAPGTLTDHELHDLVLWHADLVERLDALGPRLAIARDEVARRYVRLRDFCETLRLAPVLHGAPTNLFSQMNDRLWSELTRIVIP